MSLRRFTPVAALVAVVLFVVFFHLDAWSRPPDFAVSFFASAALIVIATLALAARGRSFSHLPVPPGRVVAVVPTYNEQPELLEAAVSALLAGTMVPDVIHVVDDGSAIPATVIQHPRVRWHRQANLGKRQAQMTALTDERDVDFVLTIDSDSVADPHALEEAIKAFSLPHIQAVTATCVVRNRSENLLTRLTDLEVVTGNAVTRRARSVLGVVAPTSGPFAIYRAQVILDNRDDYLASGTYGDDRRLTHYALLRGQVVACDEAIVEMEMPATVGAMLRQRTRWYQGYFRYLGWELRNLDGAALLLRIWNLILLATLPVVAVACLVLAPLSLGRVYWEGLAYWLAIVYAQTLHYLGGRPHLALRPRWFAWLFLTPLLVGLQWLVIRPAMLLAATRVGSSDWGTRHVEPA